jgi:hypothetical protein
MAEKGVPNNGWLRRLVAERRQICQTGATRAGTSGFRTKSDRKSKVAGRVAGFFCFRVAGFFFKSFPHKSSELQ